MSALFGLTVPHHTTHREIKIGGILDKGTVLGNEGTMLKVTQDLRLAGECGKLL